MSHAKRNLENIRQGNAQLDQKLDLPLLASRVRPEEADLAYERSDLAEHLLEQPTEALDAIAPLVEPSSPLGLEPTRVGTIVVEPDSSEAIQITIDSEYRNYQLESYGLVVREALAIANGEEGDL